MSRIDRRTVLKGSAVAAAAAQKFVTSGHRAVVKASAGGYVNYVEAGRSVNSYYGTSLGRLHAVKKKYDGSDFFRTPYTFA